MNVEGQGHCAERDGYGDNDCHFAWGEVAAANYTVQFTDQIESEDLIIGNLKVGMIDTIRLEQI